MDLGWFIFAGFIISAYAVPLLLASNRVLSMGHSWLTSVATWTTTWAIMALCLLFAKSDARGMSSSTNDEEE
jgi:hypothetical protein